MTDKQSISQPLLRPFLIGDILIGPPLILAPMAGHTNHAFRTLCRDIGGCGLVCTELLSSNAMKYNGLARSVRVFDWTDDERPFAVQLFGSDPGVMAEAAQIVVDYGAQIVDINMGCWVPKIARKGGGAALLRDVDTATRVVESVVKAVDVPVTVKVRSGWEPGRVTAVDFARAAEQAGVRAIAVHARFANQGHQGDADWEIIRQVKEVVTGIPVIGNGDIKDAQDAARMLTLTGCDGVMIGRAALGHPWLFQQISAKLRSGVALPPPTCGERAALALQHAYRTVETTSGRLDKTILELRGQLSKYPLDDPGSVMIRNRLVRVETLEDIEHILLPLIETENVRSAYLTN